MSFFIGPVIPWCRVKPAGALLALEHFLLLNEVDALVGQGGKLFIPHLECVAADELRVGVVEEGPVLVDQPRVAGLAGLDVLHQVRQQHGQAEVEDQQPRVLRRERRGEQNLPGGGVGLR
jgi:hypothetical protein